MDLSVKKILGKKEHNHGSNTKKTFQHRGKYIEGENLSYVLLFQNCHVSQFRKLHSHSQCEEKRKLAGIECNFKFDIWPRGRGLQGSVNVKFHRLLAKNYSPFMQIHFGGEMKVQLVLLIRVSTRRRVFISTCHLFT